MKFPFKFEYCEKVPFNDGIENITLGKAHISEILRFYSEKPELETSNKYNGEKFIECMYDEKDDWRGGSFDDIFKKRDLSIIKKYNETHFKQFSNQLLDHSSRKRVRSEYDGDWDFDKRYDISPFSKRALGKVKKRSIKIYGEVSFSSMTSSKIIDNYGAFIVALVNFFEKQGVNVDLYLTKTGTGAIGGDYSEIDRMITHIKRSGEYLAKEDMLKIFSSVYFRRIGFTQIIMASEFRGKTVCGSLGRPIIYNKTFEYKKDNNELHIYSNPDFSQQKQIVELLAKELIT